MGDSASTLNIAYLAQGKIRLKAGDAPPRTIDSAYGNLIREKAVRAQQRHSWKSGESDSSPFSSSVLWGRQAGRGDVPLAITSICAGKEKGDLIYSLESGSLCAMLEIKPDSEERRLWNDNRTRIRHITASRQNGDLVFSTLHENGTANIGVKVHGEGGVSEITEGDSFDTAPRWVPGEERKVVFQSAGIGRDHGGHFLALGPFSLQKLDVVSGEMTTLMEDTHHDFLAPQCLDDGSLLYIRRPYLEHNRMQPLNTIKEFFLFPVRLLFAVFQFLNLFSWMFAGRKLTSAGGPKAREMDMKQMMIWGNMVQAQRPDQPQEEGADLVPKSWELHRQDANGKVTVLARGVLAYDVAEDGTIAYTNGSAVFLLHPDGRKEHVLNEGMIAQVFFVPA